jgi:hypothetical protein
VKIPYAMVAAVPVPARHAQMAEALRQGHPRLQAMPIDDRRSLTLACYGPSLADTWQTMRPPILSMSGATRFLADRGVIADYHVDMDPRPHKARHIDPPIDGVQYLMASCVPPATWDILRGQRVTLWHAFSGTDPETNRDTLAWLQEHDPGHLMIHGGSSIGLTALHIGGLLGYRHFEVHGMDSSSREGQRHAGPHYGHVQGGYTWAAGRVTYQTSRIMANAAAEMLNTIDHYPLFCVFHGTGLLQALVREHGADNACCADETEKAERIRTAVTTILPMPVAGPRAVPWMPIMALLQREWIDEIVETFAVCETYRAQADFNTGSISVDSGLILRCLCEYVRPRVAVEIGTFIGKSTMAIRPAAGMIYTCDRSNDCFPETPGIVRFPRQTSTQMLTRLVAQGTRADLFFFDGRVQVEDVPLIARLSHPGTVYAFDDYRGEEKGVVNVRRLRPLCPRHRLIEPLAPADSMIAVLLP